ncbi:conserved protein, unknown function [Hepatocystis sp. ex Piliocolobus tephrosceles]|nr:conserved protein, unknown function [Hepatocystis sp. ex Piliocolobus tephrosceles]
MGNALYTDNITLCSAINSSKQNNTINNIMSTSEKKKKKKVMNNQNDKVKNGEDNNNFLNMSNSEKIKNLSKKGTNNTNKTYLELLKTKKRVKRYNPSKAILRNVIFLVQYKINDTFYPLLLELRNDPQCKIIIFDEYNNIIKEIKIYDIQAIECLFNTIDIFLKINNKNVNENQFNLCSFLLKNVEDKNCFIHNVKMFYGLNVLEYDTVKYNKINTQQIEEKYIFNNKNNKLNNGYKNQLQLLLEEIQNSFPNKNEENIYEQNINKNKIHQLICNTTELGNIHNPIIILGDMEDGCVIKVKEINKLTEYEFSYSNKFQHKSKEKNIFCDDHFTLIEWFLSKQIGCNNKFRKEAIYVGHTLLLKTFMIGYFIKVKVSKNIYINDKKTFVTSISVKGPVTINNKTAKQIIIYLSNVNEFIQIYLSPSDIYNIFFSYNQNKTDVLGLLIFYPAHVFIMRKGLRFAITLNDISYSADYYWDSFYLTKKDILFDKPLGFIPTYIDMSDLHLYFVTSK